MQRRIRVCVADDDAQVAGALALGLSAHDYVAVEVHSGQEALDACAGGDIDLLLLDVSMPGMDGFEVCERLKENPATRDIPVIFVTARGEPDAVEKGMSLGAVDYITKPFNLPMVMVRLESVLTGNNGSESPTVSNQASFLDSAYTDYITGLRNQRYLMERLQEEADKAFRHDFPVSCIVFDLDDVVPVEEGQDCVSTDDLLVEVAMALRSYSRTYDILARYDDTLFAVLLPHAPLSEALLYSEKILNEVGATTFSDPKFPTKATLSAAAITFRNGTQFTADAIFGEAMRTLLKSRSLGPNRVFGKDLSAKE